MRAGNVVANAWILRQTIFNYCFGALQQYCDSFWADLTMQQQGSILPSQFGMQSPCEAANALQHFNEYALSLIA